MRYIYVLAGGGLGSLARYVASVYVLSHYGGDFPLGTFLINVSGSFLIGLILTRLAPASDLRFLLVTGFLGGYTTFSSFEWETLAAARKGLPGIALLYSAGSVIAGYGACWAGSALAGR
jgi:CrcB protein